TVDVDIRGAALGDVGIATATTICLRNVYKYCGALDRKKLTLIPEFDILPAPSRSYGFYGGSTIKHAGRLWENHNRVGRQRAFVELWPIKPELTLDKPEVFVVVHSEPPDQQRSRTSVQDYAVKH